MLPNLDKLQQKCRDLGLTVHAKGKKPTKEDCVVPLREYYMPEGGLPYTELTPMLCFAEWNLKPEEKEEIWSSRDWWAQEKLNGCRLILHFVKGKGVFAHSRTISLKTYRFQELTNSLIFCGFVPNFTATIDCEVKVDKSIDTRGYTAKGEVTKTSLHSTTSILHLEPAKGRLLQVEQDAYLQFHVLDITRMDEKDLRNSPLHHRNTVLRNFVAMIKKLDLGKYFHHHPYIIGDKRYAWDELKSQGKEGLVFKHRESTYEDSSSRLRTAWVKMKKRIDFDAFVTGFIRGEQGTGWENLVGALEFSVLDRKTGKAHPIAMCSSMELEFRKKISIYDSESGEVRLLSRIYGKVAEVSGQELTPRVLRLAHATLDRWRDQTGDEKNKEDCVVDLDELRLSVEWS